MAYGTLSKKVAATSSSAALVGAGVVALSGYAIRETTGGAGASVRIWDGAGAAGPMMVPITLSANESVRDWFGSAMQQTGGIGIASGALYLEVISGSVEGSVFYEASE